MRKPRNAVFVPGFPVHIFLRGNNRRRLFSYPSDYLAFVRFVADALRRTGCELHAFMLMRNHVHLVVTAPSAKAMSAFVHRFAQRYATYRNRRTGSTGKLFEERFGFKSITSDAQFAATIPYVELNPVRAGIVEHPGEYTWSSYWLHAGDPSRVAFARDIWTPSRWYLELANDSDERSRAYVEWFIECWKRAVAVDHAEEIARVEEASQPDTRRLQRPDGSCAREDVAAYETEFDSWA